jgi:hypothetical protein
MGRLGSRSKRITKLKGSNRAYMSDSKLTFDTRPVLAAISELVARVLAGRDDEPAIRARLADGSASLRFAFDSSELVLSLGLKSAGQLEPLDAIFADGHELAGRRVVDAVFELAGSRASH